MTWFKVDDGLHAHNKIRKVLADEPAALALWVVAGSWSSDNLSDGFVPDHQLPWLIPARAEDLARTLVAARLWRRVRGGYQFHEWHSDGDGTKRNPSRKEVEEERRKKAEAGRKGGVASGKTRSRNQARASASASARAGQVVEPPTRPSLSSRERGEERAPAERGAALAPPLGAGHPPSRDSREPEDEQFWRDADEEVRRQVEATTAEIAEQQRITRSGAALARAALQAKEAQRADPS